MEEEDFDMMKDIDIPNTQNFLRQKGLYKGAIDGIWGSKSKAAAKAYLESNGSTIGKEGSFYDTYYNPIMTVRATQDEKEGKKIYAPRN